MTEGCSTVALRHSVVKVWKFKVLRTWRPWDIYTHLPTTKGPEAMIDSCDSFEPLGSVLSCDWRRRLKVALLGFRQWTRKKRNVTCRKKISNSLALFGSNGCGFSHFPLSPEASLQKISCQTSSAISCDASISGKATPYSSISATNLAPDLALYFYYQHP
ncbi:uncharacterized protein G2W53_011975 [Senna tora]|uniref:Uncharacterized protein n=1 Tax=Senna tora TaxID=362788 RepID=A0A834WPA6_9FABA|nr:uncharacterized protein G2W53_011975 [Senna tora]